MVKRVLVTTAIEETWPEDEPVLFLGEWCRLYARKECWSAMDAEVLPYHWDDRSKMYADYQYLQQFYERTLNDLADQLNQIHCVNHEVRYWRILIGPWLICFIHVLFDRWTTIQKAVQEHDISGVVVLSSSQEKFVPDGMADYTDIALNDEGNEQLYATILRQFTDVPYSVLDRKEKVEPSERQKRVKRSLKDVLTKGYIRLANILSRDTDIVFFMANLSFSKIKVIFSHFNQVPQLRHTPEVEHSRIDPSQRDWCVQGEGKSDFEVAAKTLIPQFIPSAYLEGYKKLRDQALNLPWPTSPQLIYTNNGQYYVDVFKAWMADKTEAGSKLVIGQHGGQYGIGLWGIQDDHEIAIADSFLSWGWSDSSQSMIKPVGMLSAVPQLDVKHQNQPHALLVTVSLPRYSYWIRSMANSASQWLDYFDDQCAFVENLPKHIYDALIVRLYYKDYEWDQEGRWKDRFPNLKIDSDQTDMKDLMRKSRIYITTYNATTYLETFAANIPTVIYWNPDHWELRESVIPYFEGLKRVGVFHETPQSAAKHVTDIWDDIDMWWNSSEVREEVERFSQQYCHVPNDLLGKIGQSIKETMKNPSKIHVNKN